MKSQWPRWAEHLLFWLIYWLAMSLYGGMYDHKFGRAAVAQALELPLRAAMVYLVFWRISAHSKGDWWRWLLEIVGILGLYTVAYRLLMYFIVYPVCYKNDYTFEFWNAYRFGYMLLDLSFTLFLALSLRFSRKIIAQDTPPLHATTVPIPSDPTDALFFKVNKQQVRVMLSEIVYIESMKEYSKIHLKTRFWVTQVTLAEMERRLPPHQFVRIHRSYMINRHKITAYSATEVVLEQVVLPIGKTYKGVGLIK